MDEENKKLKEITETFRQMTDAFNKINESLASINEAFKQLRSATDVITENLNENESFDFLSQNE